MARKKKKGGGGGGGEETPEWLVTFSDVMTLLLTFFVLLLSMASLQDIKKKHLAIGSISDTFGLGKQNLSIMGKKVAKNPEVVEPGVMDTGDLAPLSNLIWEDINEDLDFKFNKFIQVFTVSGEILFKARSAVLTSRGKRLLEQMVPTLKRLRYPVLIAGHTSLFETQDMPSREGVDPSWFLSIKRALAVYTYLIKRGVPSKKLRVEAYAKYHPLYPNETAEGRKKNRRVDFILDKRDYMAHNPNKLLRFEQIEKLKQIFKYKGFDFNLNSP